MPHLLILSGKTWVHSPPTCAFGLQSHVIPTVKTLVVTSQGSEGCPASLAQHEALQ